MNMLITKKNNSKIETTLPPCTVYGKITENMCPCQAISGHVVLEWLVRKLNIIINIFDYS